MLNILIVGAGGFVGSVLRYLVGLGVARMSNPQTFPWATFTVNLIGSLCIGILGAYVLVAKDSFSEEMRLFLMVGLLGGFTTFSAFSLDTFQLLRTTPVTVAFANVLLHIVMCLCATWGGFLIAKKIGI